MSYNSDNALRLSRALLRFKVIMKLERSDNIYESNRFSLTASSKINIYY